MSIHFEQTTGTTSLTSRDLYTGLQKALRKLGPRKNVLVIPPDYTRLPSRAGILTQMVREFYGNALKMVLPALGTHRPMTAREKKSMFGDMPARLFRNHNWRKDVVTLGKVPASFVKKVSGGALSFAWPVQVNKLLAGGKFDLILSIGQIVPHEVAGMAGYTKNIVVGTGGPAGIGLSHYLGAVYGMERIMGRIDNPVRRVFDYAAEHCLTALPIVYALTVISSDGKRVQGLFVGDDRECFEKAAALSQKLNITVVDRPIDKAVVYCDPGEYTSTWLANKSIYRTRMALADNAELVVLAPGVERFGEDPVTDRLIRRHGYCGTKEVLRRVKVDSALANRPGVAAHLIHGSTEGRFRVTYCPGRLTQDDITAVGYSWADPKRMLKLYKPHARSAGWNTMPDGSRFFFIRNPGLGLWTAK